MIYLDFVTGFNFPPYCWFNQPQIVQPFPKKEEGDDTSDEEMDRLRKECLNMPHTCPLKIKWEEEENWWQFPVEPVISVTGKNIIIRRNVLKQNNERNNIRGSVKEIWSQDDYEINIASVFITDDGELPKSEISKLRDYCEKRKTIEVSSDLLMLFNINKLAIEEYQFPFTKGKENQMFTLKAYSDDVSTLLIEQ